MAGYVVAQPLRVKDAAGMDEYRAKLAATVEQYGGRFLARLWPLDGARSIG